MSAAGGAGGFVNWFGDGLVLVFAAAAVAASFGGEPADAYHFPQLVSALLLVFAVVNIGQKVVGASAAAESAPLSWALARRLAPGVIIAAAYIYVCDIIGFYWSAAAAFVLLTACYRPHPRRRAQWLHIAVATAIMMAFVYALFNLFLKVQTPDPFWIV